MRNRPLLIAIDGPSGVGKSTIAAEVARRLDLPYLETGAMYRALGWQLLQAGISPSDREKVEQFARRLAIDIVESGNNRAQVLLNGETLAGSLRAPEVSEATSVASSHPGVRREMVERQRSFASARGAVLEGRDIGSKVFPETPYKFFLTAPQEVRVARRVNQLQQVGADSLDIGAIEAEVEHRDERDRQREESPLTMDDSYTVLDTSQLSVEQAVSTIVSAVR